MRPLLAAVLVLSLAAAGCGSSGSSSSSSSSGSTPAAAPAAGASAGAIDIKGFAFNPTADTVKVGQKVTWTNDDTAVHNVVADNGAFKSKDLSQGDTFSFTPTKAGTFAYVCQFHANMKATLTVTG